MSPHYTKMESKKTWVLGDKFEARMPHHQGIKELWETKWKFPVGIQKNVYKTNTYIPSVLKVCIHFTMENMRTSLPCLNT